MKPEATGAFYHASQHVLENKLKIETKEEHGKKIAGIQKNKEKMGWGNGKIVAPFFTLTKKCGPFENQNMYMSCSQIVKTSRSRWAQM